MTKKLTLDMLNEMGISLEWSESEDGWIVWRTRHTKRHGLKKYRIKRSIAYKEHKYAKDKFYPIYAWSYKNKTYTYTESKLVWAWMFGVVPEGYDVDHKGNDPFDNHIEKLQLLTREENLAKRFSDDPTNKHNQYK